MDYIVQDSNGNILKESPEIRIARLAEVFREFKDKLNNIYFNFDGVRYRHGVIKRIFSSHMKWAEAVHISEEGTAEADSKVLERLKLQAMETGKVQRCRIENDFGWESHELDHELISQITYTVTFIHNIIDLWLTLNGFERGKNRHWALTDYLKPNESAKAFVGSDEYFRFVRDEDELWIHSLKEKRHKAIHRIAERNPTRLMPIKQWEVTPEGEITSTVEVIYRGASLESHLDVADDYFARANHFFELALSGLERFAREKQLYRDTEVPTKSDKPKPM